MLTLNKTKIESVYYFFHNNGQVTNLADPCKCYEFYAVQEAQFSLSKTLSDELRQYNSRIEHEISFFHSRTEN